MGRKSSNVWDYFDKLLPRSESNPTTHERYACKVCKQSFAKNATRLMEHLVKNLCSNDYASQTIVSSSSKATTGRNPHKRAKSRHYSISSRLSSSNTSNSEDNLVDEEDIDDGVDVVDDRVNGQSHSLNGLASTRLVASSLNESNHDVIARLSNASVCAIADAMSQLQLKCHLKNISILPGYKNILDVNVCGPAYTIRMYPLNGKQQKNSNKHHVDKIPSGSVVAIHAPEGTNKAVWGALNACRAVKLGCAGVITNGGVRDVQDICRMGLHVFSSGTAVYSSSGDTYVESTGGDVVIGEITIRSGDIIRGDVNGVIVIPSEHISEVVNKAEIIEQQDIKISQAIMSGDTLSNAIAKHHTQCWKLESLDDNEVSDVLNFMPEGDGLEEDSMIEREQFDHFIF